MDWNKISEDVLTKSLNNKDFFMKANDLRMNPQNGRLTGLDEKFNSIDMPLNDWAAGQLFLKNDMPSKYFKRMINEDQFKLVSDHVNYHLNENDLNTYLIRSHQYGDMKEREIRAVLSDSYSPLDNKDLIEIVNESMDSSFKHKIINYHNDNNLTMSIRITMLDMEENIGERHEDDILKVGLLIMNSEVGRSGIRILPLVYRVFCDNGMAIWETLKGDNNSFYKRHRWINKNEIYKWATSAIHKAADEASKGIIKLKESKKVEVSNPSQYILTKIPLLNNSQKNKILQIWEEQWQESEQAHTMFAIVNSITNAAREYEPETRLEFEKIAGKLVA